MIHLVILIYTHKLTTSKTPHGTRDTNLNDAKTQKKVQQKKSSSHEFNKRNGNFGARPSLAAGSALLIQPRLLQ